MFLRQGHVHDIGTFDLSMYVTFSHNSRKMPRCRPMRMTSCLLMPEILIPLEKSIILKSTLQLQFHVTKTVLEYFTCHKKIKKLYNTGYKNILGILVLKFNISGGDAGSCLD